MSKEIVDKSRTAAQAAPIHVYLSRMIDALPELTNVEIARRLEYPRPNVISMMRTGTMKIPLDIIPRLANILEIEPLSLLQRALIAYSPDLWKVLEMVAGAHVVTSNELELLSLLREETRGLDPSLARNEAWRQRFARLVGELVDEQALQELAESRDAPRKTGGAAAAANSELAELMRRQARERLALRRELAA